MGFFENFPYSNFHNLNLDWILETVKRLETEMSDFTISNSITFAGVWSITRQYKKWSIVTHLDSSFLSIDDVPSGIDIENLNFWEKISDISPQVARIERNVDSLAVNIMDFGANVHSSDNSGAIQSALNSLKNSGGVVFVPDGIWTIASPLVINTNMTLRGNGRGSVIKLANNANCDMLNSYGFYELLAGTSDKEPYHFTVENIVFDGNAANNNNGNGIRFYGADFDIKNVVVQNVADSGIFTTGTTDAMPTGTKIESLLRDVDIMFTGENGLIFNGPTDSYMENITVVNASQKSDNVYDSIVFNNNCRCVHMHPWNFNDSFGYKRPRYSLFINASNCIIDDSHIEGGRTASLCVNKGVVGGTISNTMIYASFGNYLVEMGGAIFTFSNCTLTGKANDSTKEYLYSIKFLEGANNFTYTGSFLEDNPLTDRDVPGSTYIINAYSPNALNFEKQLQYSVYIFNGAKPFSNLPNLQASAFHLYYDNVNLQPVFYNPNTGNENPYPGAVMYRDGALKRYDVNNGWVAV